MVEDTNLGVPTSLTHKCQSMLLILELLPHSKLHCRLGYPSLPLFKKLYPQFFSLSSLNCESYQYVKLHRVHLSLRINKRASAPFELVHYDVWGPCPVLSLTRFKYFVTFVDDFSHVT